MNPLNAVILMILGIILGLGILFVIAWIMNQGKRLPPRYIKETQRWLWLLNKYPLRIWKEKSPGFRVKWTNWDLGKGMFISNSSNYLPEIGDIIVVQGRYGMIYMLVVTSVEYPHMESCYIGYLYA